MIDYWDGCYDDGWKGIITDTAFAHPAKFSRGLIFRIIEHALACGLIQPGGLVVDPFGGVGLGAAPSLMTGLSWVGCELEPRFVEMGRKNIELWNSRFSGMPKWTGTAQLLQGDSRRLAEVVKAAGPVVGSPPFHDSERTGVIDFDKRSPTSNAPGRNTQGKTAASYGSTPGQLGSMVVGPPPFAGNTGGRGDASRNGIDAALFDRHSGGMNRGTGSDPANLDHLPMGEPPCGVGEAPVVVVGSPPYAETNQDYKNGYKYAKPQGGTAQENYGSTPGQLGSMIVGSPPFAGSVGSDDPAKRGGLLVSDPRRAGDVNLTGSYGQSEGQLGAMPIGHAVVVGSPPFENVVNTKDQKYVTEKKLYGDYGASPGQLGNDTGDTFWAASRTILEQCYQILPDNAHAIWVVKNYIKNGKEVDFTGQWAALCEACGFEVVHIHRAMLVKRRGAQAGFDGEMVSKDVSRKSFFRRLAERNGSPAIDWETVLCTVKR